MTLSINFTIAIFLAVAIFVLFKLSQIGKRLPKMPPGPPTIPFLGNAHQIPADGFYKKYATNLSIGCTKTFLMTLKN